LMSLALFSQHLLSYLSSYSIKSALGQFSYLPYEALF
jgi:hypothetical protein